MFLAITPLKEFWTGEDDIVYLGSWCLFPDHLEQWQKERSKILPCPWLDHRKYRKHARYLESLSDRMLDALHLIFNEHLEQRHSLRYWKILLGQWITVYAGQYLNRYTCIKNALTMLPGFDTILLAENTSIDDVKPQYVTDIAELRSYSFLLSYLGYKCDTRKIPADWLHTQPSVLTEPEEVEIERLIKRNTRLVCGWMLYNKQKIEDILTQTGMPYDIIGYYDFDKVLPQFKPNSDHPIRKGIQAIPCRNEFERMLVSAMAMDIPAWMVEGYGYYDRIARNNISRNLNCVLSAIGCQENKIFTFIAATAADKGAKIVLSPHGSMYGTYEYLPGKRFETSIADTYLAWGWASAKDQNCKNVSSLANNVIPVEPASTDNSREKILYLSNDLTKYFTDFRSGIKCFGSDHYFEWICTFFQSLDASLYDKIFFRSKGYMPASVSEYLCKNFKGIIMDTRGTSLQKRIAESKIAVCDCFTQVYLDALQNLPTVLYWDPQTWRPNREAQKHLQKLKKAGVFWDDPVQAARHLQEVLPDPQSWWQQSSVQDAVSSFLDKFSKKNENFKTEWSEKLKNICKPESLI